MIRGIIVLLLVGILGWFFSCSMEQRLPDNALFLAGSEEVVKENRRLRRSFRSRASDNKCQDKERCKNICDQILDYAEEERDCYKLSLDDVGRLETVIDIMKDPTQGNLDDIRSRDFSIFVDYAASSWIEIIEGSYRQGENIGDLSNREDNYGEVDAYSEEEAKRVLELFYSESWARSHIGRFPIDAENIIYELLLHSGEDCSSISSSSSTNDVTLEMPSSNCRVASQLKENIFSRGRGGALFQFSLTEGSQESGFYEAMHSLAESVCEDASIQGQSYSDTKSEKICLSMLYFDRCTSTLCSLDFEKDFQGVARFLFEDTGHDLLVQASQHSGKWLDYFLDEHHEPTEGQWSDYW